VFAQMGSVIRAMKRLAAVLVCALAVPCLAAPAACARVRALGPAPASARLDVVLPLQADDAGLRRFAFDVSTPSSPQYGAYEPIALLAQRFGAGPSVRARVLRYLRAAGAADAAINPTGMFAEAHMSVALAERMFGAPLTRFAKSGGERFIAPASTSRASAARVRVPAALQGLALGVLGLDTRRVVPIPTPPRPHVVGAVRGHASAAQPPSGYVPASGTPAGCAAGVGSGGFTPNQYLSAYDYAPLRAVGLSGRGERVAVIEIDGFKYSDITTFARCFGLPVPRLSVFLVGASRELPAGGETTLDLEVLDAVAPNLDSIEVYENAGDAASVFKSFVLPLIAPGAKPQVVSASLGLCEPFLASDFGRAGINSIERDVELATATGITLVASSGDSGSASCIQNGKVVDALAVSYPASSDFVTAVGGTNVVLSAANKITAQPVWNDTSEQVAGGGGGASGLFGRPPYQRGVVGANVRAVPDVSMLADVAPGYAVFCTAPSDPLCSSSPPWHTVGGTSAAAPLIAGGAALVNQDLHRHEREFLGLMNPLLYGIGTSSLRDQVFSDVTQIGNDVGPFIPGSGGRPLGCCTAAPGYDEASGWGSIDLAGLDRVALRVLPKYGNVSVAIPRPQSPVRRRALRVRLFCSDTCLAYAFAVVTIGSHSGFTVKSHVFRFRRKGARVIPIRLSAGQLRRIRSGFAHHRRVDAEVFGVALDARHQIAKVTPGRVLRVRG
jgi:subtilase family serine protease